MHTRRRFLVAGPASVLAAPADPHRPLRQEAGEAPPLVDEAPIVEEAPVEAWLGSAEPPVEQPIEELVTPPLPANVTLAVDRAVLGAGEKALLTVRLYNDGAPPLADLALTLTLPPGVVTDSGERDRLHWKVPTLAADEPALQQVTLQLADGQATEDAVSRIQALLTQPGHAPGEQKEESVLTAAGAVVQNASGEIVLLAGPESAAGVTFRLTELYHWQEAPVEASTEPPAVVAPVAESLTETETLTVTPDAPVVTATELPTATVSVTPTATPTATLTLTPPLR